MLTNMQKMNMKLPRIPCFRDFSRVYLPAKPELINLLFLCGGERNVAYGATGSANVLPVLR